MAKTDFRSVDQYLAAQPAATRAELARVRAAIQKALPGAEEVISYQIPAYVVGGRRVLYFAGWKEHVSLYPIGARLLAAFGDELEPYAVEKATLRFPLSRPVPAKLVERIARFRAAESAVPAKKKTGAKKKSGKKVAARKA